MPNAQTIFDAYEASYQFNCGSRHEVKRLRAQRAWANMEGLIRSGHTPPPSESTKAQARILVLPDGKTIVVER